jgi:hypothetical protein
VVAQRKILNDWLMQPLNKKEAVVKGSFFFFETLLAYMGAPFFLSNISSMQVGQ